MPRTGRSWVASVSVDALGPSLFLSCQGLPNRNTWLSDLCLFSLPSVSINHLIISFAQELQGMHCDYHLMCAVSETQRG